MQGAGQSSVPTDDRPAFSPAYLRLLPDGGLARRAAEAQRRLLACNLCGRSCGVDRRSQLGGCRTGTTAQVASFGPHHGEEEVLRGWAGSGTIFFGSCNLHCVFCQNADISQTLGGSLMPASELAEVMLWLQARGCHNINLVSPTHVVPMILEAVAEAAGRGLHLPLVYNTGGYDSLETLALLDGVVDIYMPDMKYAEADVGLRLSGAKGYPAVNAAAVRAMQHQVGDLEIDGRGLAQRGLLVRHLVLPEGLSGTERILRFLAAEISPHTAVNLMAQYRPAYRADAIPELRRRTTAAEYDVAWQAGVEAGLTRLPLCSR
ncbi:MAG: radical SAM protein [Anaerolineales bacterium]|nr:radical SAM protein [Anaerolineales bacterium]